MKRPAESVLFIDDVPVAWRAGSGDWFSDYGDVMSGLGDRARVGVWWGEFPLTGELLARSLALHDDVLVPLIRAAHPSWIG